MTIKQNLFDSAMIELDLNKQPNSLNNRYARNDVIRAPHLNFYCTENQADTSPGNHWMTPDDAYTKGGFGE